MAESIQDAQLALSDNAARQLANATKTVPQLSTISPRWLVHLLQWSPVEAGIFRLNRVKNPRDVRVACAKRDESELPQTFVDYEENPREYFLNAVSTVLDVHTRVSDLYSSPHDQIREQLRLTIETIKERQENELINNPEYGLLANVDETQRISTLTGAPTPDDLDELITRVWKEPGFFLAHPLAIAAFGRECTRRGVPPPTVSLFGSQFLTWRGLPLVPSDKVPVDEDGKTKILLQRVGEKRQGVIGLYQPGLAGEQSPGLSVRFMGISRNAIASYLISLEKAPGAAGQPVARGAFDVQAVRRDFPILAERVNGKPLVWFDNAATTQKPQAVIDRLAYFYAHENSNIHRAAHELAARATDAFEAARGKGARFLGAKSADEIVFVRGATEAINLVANTYGRQHITEGDEIVVSLLEHHANIVPWQQLAAATGAKIRVIPVDDSGQILLEEYSKLLNGRTKLVAITQVSNALGTVTPVREIVALAHGVGARVLVDGAQAVSHFRVNVQALDADFYVFSGHKVFAPTGVGALYGKLELLESLPPWQGGGNMIQDVTFEKTTYQGAPARFEAGTGNIADAVGLGAAIDYLESIGFDAAGRYEHDLLQYASHGLQTVPGLRLIGTAADKASVLSFVLAGYRTEEVGTALNREGIAVRSGHHCAQPILRRFGLEATGRPSLAFYNTCEEVDLLVATLHRLARGQRSALN